MLVFLPLLHFEVDSAQSILLISRLTGRVNNFFKRDVLSLDWLFATKDTFEPGRLHLLQGLLLELLLPL